MCVSYFLLSKMKERENFMLSSTWSSSRTFQPIDKKKKVKEMKHEVFHFAATNILDMKSQIISQLPSYVLHVKEFIYFSLTDILRTGCQAHLSLHLQLTCVCTRFQDAVQFSGREQFVSFPQWVSFLRTCCTPTIRGAATLTQNYGWSIFLKNTKRNTQ